jgi:hypothetical protein
MREVKGNCSFGIGINRARKEISENNFFQKPSRAMGQYNAVKGF